MPDNSNLDDFLVKIREAIPYSEINANPFFYLVKPTEENLGKYKLPNPQSSLRYLIEIAFHFPLLIIELIRTWIIAFYSYWDSRQSSAPVTGNFPNLFVSHFTYAQIPKNNDIFFGSSNQESYDFTFYLNHTRLKRNKIIEMFRECGKFRIDVNAKTLGPICMLRLQSRQFQTSFWLFRYAMRQPSLTLIERRLLIRSARAQHSRGTMSNLVFKKCLKDLIGKVQPTSIIFTLEGHSHEALIIDLRNEVFANTRLVAYQHAPLVPSQRNIFRIASRLTTRDYFLTSGKVVMAYALINNLSCSIGVLGTPKYRKYFASTKDYSRIRVLFAPEGTKESLYFFANLAKQVALKMPQFTCILRPHPALGPISSRFIQRFFEGSKNSFVSYLPLIEDLQLSNFIIFQSSSVGIEGLAHGIYPIHVSPLGDESLNPLAFFESFYSVAKTEKDVIKIINEFDLNILASSVFQERLFAFFEDFYAPMRDIKRLID